MHIAGAHQPCRRRVVAAAALLLAIGCTAPASDPVRPSPSAAPATDQPTQAAPRSPTPRSTGDTARALQQVGYRVESRTRDAATADFARTVDDVLTDPRGWIRAGFAFERTADAEYVIVLAEGRDVDKLCLPLQTWSTYSCQNGPVVALNADRWRSATPKWTGSLEAYRVMLINHEVGHLLHLHHPTEHCPAAGLPAPVMAQQSTELGRCEPNPWPLQWEIDLAAERREPLAPPADHDPSDHRPTPPPANS